MRALEEKNYICREPIPRSRGKKSNKKGKISMKVMRISGIVIGILLILGGISCVLAPSMTYIALAWVAGISMAADAIGIFIGISIIASGVNLITFAIAKPE